MSGGRDERGRFAPGNPGDTECLLRMIGGAEYSEEEVVRAALEREGGSVTAAARSLGYDGRSRLWYHLRRLGLSGLPREIRERARARFSAA